MKLIKNWVKRRCLRSSLNYYERWRIRGRGKLESDMRIFNDSFTDSRDLKGVLFPLGPAQKAASTRSPAQIKPDRKSVV